MKTGTVMDSVHQINTRCMELIKESEDLPYVDVGIAANTLNNKCKEMLDLFDKSPNAYLLLTDKKRAVEDAAIRLETLMYTWNGTHEETVTLRAFASKLYDDVRAVFYRSTKIPNLTPHDVAMWGAHCKWALQFSIMSKHILFETDNDDDSKIKEITNELKAFYEKYGER